MPFTLTMPKLSPTMEEGTLIKWHKKEGEFVESGELLLDIATDKATVEYNALDEGWLRKILVAPGEAARINQPIAVFSETEQESVVGYVAKGIDMNPAESPSLLPSHEQGGKAEMKGRSEVSIHQGRIIASPLARRLAQERGIDLRTLTGSGPGGRITSRDLDQAPSLRVGGKTESFSLPVGTYEEIALTPVRKVIARRLQESKSTIPHFYLYQEIDADPLHELRQQLKAHDINVTFNDMIIKAAALSLQKHPGVNTGFNDAKQSIIQFKTIDVSVAVTIEGGLITPIIRYADAKSIGEISQEVRKLAAKAHAGKLTEEEYKGGSFCISNLGMFGITGFTAVINPPQAAILAIGAIEEGPVVKAGQIVVGKRVLCTLSADHRVIDGAVGAQFMKTLQYMLEHPAVLTLPVQ